MEMLRVVDFETDGAAPPASVIEAGWCDLTRWDGKDWRVGAPTGYLCGGGKITAETRAVHHISPAEIDGRPPFDPERFAHMCKGIDAVAAHNAAFEGQWLAPALRLVGMPLLCTYKAALRVWPDAPAHKNQVLRYWLEEQGLAAPDPALAHPAHRAPPDAYATAWVLRALLERATVEEMIAWTAEPAAIPRCPIGEKWRGKRWAEVDPGFLGWMLRQPTMDPDLKWNAQRELARRAG